MTTIPFVVLGMAIMAALIAVAAWAAYRLVAMTNANMQDPRSEWTMLGIAAVLVAGGLLALAFILPLILP